MQLSVEKIVRIAFFFLLLFFAAACASQMLLMENSFLVTNYNRYFLILAFLAWAAAAVALCVLPGFKVYTMPFTVTAYLVYSLWVVFPSILITTTQESFVMRLVDVGMPIVVLALSYTVARNYGHSQSSQLAFLALGVVCAFQFVRVMFDFSAIAEESHLVCAYFVMYALPLMMLVKQKVLRILLAMAVLIVIFASFKRGGLIALAFGLIAYLVTMQLIANKMSVGSILIGMVVLAVFVIIFILLGTSGDTTVFDRFENMGSNDTGSGRTLVWPVTLGMIENSDALGLLFGHGSGAVQMDSPIMLSAHNDFLEITYDYGLLGLALYVVAFVSLGFYILRMIREKSPYAPSMVLLYAVYGILSLISHVAIYYWMSVVLLTVGYCIGCNRHDAILSEQTLETLKPEHAVNE